MTAAATSVVTVERAGNVAFVTWHEPLRPPVRSEPPAVGGGSTCRRARREWAAIAGLLAAGILCVAFNSQITDLVHTLLGGAR